MNKKHTYHFIIGISLLLFTQLVIPNLHHHTEKHQAQGINAFIDDECLICSIDIIPADFISPAVFSFLILILFHTSVACEWNTEVLIFSIHKKGRAPPLAIA